MAVQVECRVGGVVVEVAAAAAVAVAALLLHQALRCRT